MTHNQDRAGMAGAPLGVFRDGQLIELVPDGAPDNGRQFRDHLAEEHGVDPAAYEVLLSCPDHPDASALDCLDCEPR